VLTHLQTTGGERNIRKSRANPRSGKRLFQGSGKMKSACPHWGEKRLLRKGTEEDTAKCKSRRARVKSHPLYTFSKPKLKNPRDDQRFAGAENKRRVVNFPAALIFTTPSIEARCLRDETRKILVSIRRPIKASSVSRFLLGPDKETACEGGVPLKQKGWERLSNCA